MADVVKENNIENNEQNRPEKIDNGNTNDHLTSDNSMEVKNKEISSGGTPDKYDKNLKINEEIDNNEVENSNENQVNLKTSQDSSPNDLNESDLVDEVNISSFPGCFDSNPNDEDNPDSGKNVNLSVIDLDKSTMNDLRMSFENKREKTDANFIENENNKNESNVKNNTDKNKNKKIEIDKKAKTAFIIAIVFILLLLITIACLGLIFIFF